ncbi:MAG: aminotransferase class I/II-fold pyridoxal phosphate-dependent enzyme [Myxococcota bacterium]
MKAALRPFEYMAWAMSAPKGAKVNLTASGMADTVAPPALEDGPTRAEGLALADAWAGPLETSDQCSRDARDRAVGEFIETVAARYGVPTDRVTPTLGASLAITHVLLALIRPGDQVIVERPTYEALHRVPEVLGANVSRLDRKYEDGWAVVPERLARLLTSRTRAVILSNLHNPTGVGIDRATLAEITELAARVGAVVLVDEVYLDYCFPDGSSTAPTNIAPACTVADNCVSWSSSTKCFGFSALRAGWIVAGQPETARAIRAATDFLHVHPPMATVELGQRVLAQAERLTRYASAVSAAGQAVVQDWLAKETRVGWVPPTAGITGCVRLPHLMQDVPFAEHLRERYETQVVPGSFFEAPGTVRLSFGVDPATLRDGLAAFSAALDDLG